MTTLGEKGPRAIGIDLLFDQPTEPAKDEALMRALASLKMPVLIAYTEADNVVSPEQKAYLDSFVPQEKRAVVTLAEDQFVGSQQNVEKMALGIVQEMQANW